MATIEQFKGVISKAGGVARPNVFAVGLPTNIPGVNIDRGSLNLLCRDVQLPGRQILSNDRVIGQQRSKVAYGYAVSEVSMTFLCLNDYGIRKYFEAWQNAAVNQDTFEVGYHNEYTRLVTIQQLKKGLSFPVYSTPLGIPKLPTELQNRLPKIGPFDFAQGEFDLDIITRENVIYACELQKAYPTSMNAIQLNNDLDGLVELNVQFSYTNWKQI